jgi:TolC family type I secretion outer membrane protein
MIAMSFLPSPRRIAACAARLLMPLPLAIGCASALIAAMSHAADRTDPFQTDQLRPAVPSQFWTGPTVPCPQQPVVPDPLTLVQAVDIALCQNPQTRQSWAVAKVQAAAVGEARSAYLPDINASASLQRSEVRNTPNAGGFTDLRASLSLDYLLFDFGGRAANVALARESLLAANWTHNNTLQVVILNAVQGYYQLFATQEAVQSTLAAEKASLASLEAARARLKAGTATRADVLQTQTAYSQAQLDRTQAEGDAAAARGILANALGLPAQRELRIAPPPDLEAQKVSERAVDELIEDARRLRPDLAAAQAQVRAAESNVVVQQSVGRPTISAFGALDALQASPGSDPRSGAVGVQLNIPLFTGFRNTYRVYQARAQVELDTASRDRLESDIALDVWRAYQDLRTQRQSLDTASDLVASAQENYNVALARYKAGVGTITDLLNAQSALVNAELQRIRARYQWNLAKATLAKAIGVLQPDLIEQRASPTYNR